MKALRSLLLMMGLSLAFGLVLGTCVRRGAEAPVRYIGEREAPGASALAAGPGHVGHAGPAVLDARHHEQQVREPVHVA